MWFSDAFTPRRDWTFSHSINVAMAIRSYCHANCRCAIEARRERPAGQLTWQVTEDLETITMAPGPVSLYRSSSGDSLLEILPNPQFPPSSGTCGVNKRQFCVKPWPKDLLGPIPRRPPRMKVGPPTVAAPTAPTQCGTSCTKQSDCRPSNGDVDCACIAPTFAEARKAGLDPIFSKTSCLVIAAQKISQGLMGRGLVARSDAPACVCNSTYVSQGCCSSDDGMIWEAAHLKLGSLIESA